MATQVFHAETLKVPPPPLFLQQSQNYSKRVYTPIQGVEVFPEELRSAVEKIQACFPQMFTILPLLLDRSITIQVQVDLPVSKKGFVSATALAEKNISVPGLAPDRNGQFHVDELGEKGISVHSDSMFKAHWNYQSCTMTLRHSYYSRFSEEDRIFSQAGSLMFELQNAQFSQEFREIWTRGAELSKEEFVRSLEEIEFTTNRLTSLRLSRMTKNGEFDVDFNTCRFMYENFPLYYLHQQAVNHSFQYAKAHDAKYKTQVDRPYRGTWKVPFPASSRDGELDMEQTSISTILTNHLDAIYETNPRRREQYERKLCDAVSAAQQLASAGYRWAQNVMTNVTFFQEEYNKYVSEASPERVINLLS